MQMIQRSIPRALFEDLRAYAQFLLVFAALTWGGLPLLAQDLKSSWPANATIAPLRTITDLGLGAVQGVVIRAGKVYAYGDLIGDTPRVGVIREYDLELRATGRTLRLSKEGTPLIIHPTGLTWNSQYGTLLGDTVNKHATIYQLDWDRAWSDGDLDQAVLAVVEDDVAINGCRPLFVELNGRALLATADYGEVRPEIRLYDPSLLLTQRRSSAPGVVVHRVLCGPFNQNLYWDGDQERLICVQNVVEGRGWRLDELDLRKAVADGRVNAPGVRTRTLTFPFEDELEGFWAVEGDRALFAIARRRDNVLEGRIRPNQPIRTD